MIDYKSLDLRDVKKIIFERQLKRFPHLKNFKESPYSYLKSRYYMYCSVVLVYYLLKSRVTPNMLSIVYCLCGVIGGILLSIPNIQYNIIGVFIFFNKNIFDWSDGNLAHIKYEPSVTGHILDVYGATIGSICLTIGLGFFAFNQSGHEFLIYIIAIIAFLHGEVYSSASKKIILQDFNKIVFQNKKDIHREKKINEKNSNTTINNNYPKLLSRLKFLLDERSRTVDFVLLLILIDIYYNYQLTFYIFLIISIRIFFRFILSFFFGVKSRWAELYVDELRKDIQLRND